MWCCPLLAAFIRSWTCWSIFFLFPHPQLRKPQQTSSLRRRRAPENPACGWRNKAFNPVQIWPSASDVTPASRVSFKKHFMCVFLSFTLQRSQIIVCRSWDFTLLEPKLNRCAELVPWCLYFTLLSVYRDVHLQSWWDAVLHVSDVFCFSPPDWVSLTDLSRCYLNKECCGRWGSNTWWTASLQDRIWTHLV